MSAVSAPVHAIRVATVEDDARYRASLAMLLGQAAEFTLAGSYPSPARALAELEPHLAADRPAPWDLVLMDLEIPGMDGVEGTRRLKALAPRLTVVVLTVFEDRASIVRAICAGADGYLLKRTSAAELLRQLRLVVAGGSPLSSGVARTVLDVVRQVNAGLRDIEGGRPAIDLTPREAEVLRCLVDGMSYKAVAAALDVSLDTVRTHVRAVYGKLQVHSVAEAVSRALREGLV